MFGFGAEEAVPLGADLRLGESPTIVLSSKDYTSAIEKLKAASGCRPPDQPLF